MNWWKVFVPLCVRLALTNTLGLGGIAVIGMFSHAVISLPVGLMVWLLEFL